MKAPKRPRVLYVEDNEDCCLMMSILLEMSGIDVACAHGMQKAIVFSDKQQFDLFLIDLWLKDGSGSDLCVKLRREFPNIPVVFYTGSATSQQRQTGMLSGAAAYLVKPYSDLVAPTVFRLVNEAASSNAFDLEPNMLRKLEDKAAKLMQIIAGPEQPLALSP
ncbi:MAG TPA: response regulator [Pyrinomonadaceae bacterium]|nr:response regulator [Pyrinomonadaceae bacterium]